MDCPLKGCLFWVRGNQVGKPSILGSPKVNPSPQLALNSTTAFFCGFPFWDGFVKQNQQHKNAHVLFGIALTKKKKETHPADKSRNGQLITFLPQPAKNKSKSPAGRAQVEGEVEAVQAQRQVPDVALVAPGGHASSFSVFRSKAVEGILRCEICEALRTVV